MRQSILLIALLAFTLSANTQNVIYNYTGYERLTPMIEKGLQELEIKDVTITIVPMKKYYHVVRGSKEGKLWGTTAKATDRQFTIVFSMRHDAEFKYNRAERLAHELIHVKQGYEGRKGNEREAYKKQYKLARVIGS